MSDIILPAIINAYIHSRFPKAWRNCGAPRYFFISYNYSASYYISTMHVVHMAKLVSYLMSATCRLSHVLPRGKTCKFSRFCVHQLVAKNGKFWQ